MDRFLSSAINKVDAKGRVSVPASFRAIVQKQGHTELYATRQLEIPALEVGGPERLKLFEERIAQEDPLLQAADDLAYYYYGDGAFLKLDQDGRITINDFIREHTGITTEAAFVGKGLVFQIWEPERFHAYGAEVRARLIQRRQAAAAGSGRLE